MRIKKLEWTPPHLNRQWAHAGDFEYLINHREDGTWWASARHAEYDSSRSFATEQEAKDWCQDFHRREIMNFMEDPVWSAKPPTEPGDYWLSGVDPDTGEVRTFLVKVVQNVIGLVGISQGVISRLTEGYTKGYWTPAEVPKIPSELV